MDQTAPTLDAQQVEIVGRNLLVSLFVADGIEIAQPLRDRGIDLIAFKDLADDGTFKSVPVQLKAFSKRGFGINKKYEKFPGMLIAHLWFTNEPLKAVLYIMTYQQALEIAETLGWTKTNSWIVQGGYTSNNPSMRVVSALKPYKYQPGSLAALLK